MDLPRNRFKAALLEGRPQIGLWSCLGDPIVADLLAGCGFDWLLFDTEHSPTDTRGILPLLQAAAAHPVHAAVRPTALDPAEIKKLLDFGAQTIIVPYVQTVEEARLAAAAVAYPPEGIRGVGGSTRATGFGTVPDYASRARDEIMLIVQIETRTALDALEDIVAVPGIDGAFVGPADLAASLGHRGNPGHPEARAACLDAIRRIRAAGKPAGFLSADQDFLDEIVAAGSLFTAVDIDLPLLRRAAADRLRSWREKLGG